MEHGQCVLQNAPARWTDRSNGGEYTRPARPVDAVCCPGVCCAGRIAIWRRDHSVWQRRSKLAVSGPICSAVYRYALGQQLGVWSRAVCPLLLGGQSRIWRRSRSSCSAPAEVGRVRINTERFLVGYAAAQANPAPCLRWRFLGPK